MTDMPRVRIVNVAKTPGFIPGWRTKVYIDDMDISGCVDHIQVTSALKDHVTATLRVAVNEVEYDGGMIAEFTDPKAREVLIKHGWTPPAEDEEEVTA